MYREMRRKDREMDYRQALRLLEQCEYGVLACSSAENQPYAIPLSYICENGAIYFHCARTGQKLDIIRENPDVCFTAVGNTKPIFNGDFTSLYESVVAFGKAEFTQGEEKDHALMELCRKYFPDHMAEASEEVSRSSAKTEVIKVTIAHLTGKANTGAVKGAAPQS